MQDQVGPVLEALTLESVSDGAAETMFQCELEAAAELFQAPQDWADQTGKITAKVQISIAFIYDTQTGTIQAEVSSAFKRPARKAIRRPVFKGSDGWSAVREANQLTFGDEAERGEGVRP